MIKYHPKEWFVFIFKFHKSDTIHKLLPLTIAIGIYAGSIAYMEIIYWKLSDKSYIKGVSVMHGLLSFVISLLLVFRTNTAYDRWWEGRKLWGALVNNSRNLAIKLAAILPKEEHGYFKKAIPAYAHALKNHLNQASTRTELFDEDDKHFNTIEHDKHVPNQIALLMMRRINMLYAVGKLKGDQLIIMNNELVSFTDICGACERIKNTPIPFSYSAFLKKFIFFYIMTLPFGYVFTLGYFIIPIVCFIFYVLATLELIAEEIEDPFGDDANDLPTKKMAESIHKNIHEIL